MTGIGFVVRRSGGSSSVEDHHLVVVRRSSLVEGLVEVRLKTGRIVDCVRSLSTTGRSFVRELEDSRYRSSRVVWFDCVADVV